MKIPLVEIATTDNEDSHLVHCVFCGHQQDPEDRSYCEHVSFVYLPSIGEFDYIAPEFKLRIESITKKAMESDEHQAGGITEHLTEIPGNGRNFIIELNSSGQACGPSNFTVLYGFDANQ